VTPGRRSATISLARADDPITSEDSSTSAADQRIDIGYQIPRFLPYRPDSDAIDATQLLDFRIHTSPSAPTSALLMFDICANGPPSEES
jgi:hypothetical protein